MALMSYKKHMQKHEPTRVSGGENHETPEISTLGEIDPILASLGGGGRDETLVIPTLGESTQAEASQSKSISGQGGVTSNVEEKALSLLGSGIAAEQVAAALGVTPSRIAQLLATDHFSKQVAELRYTNLQAHNVRDEAYDSLEDSLLKKLKSAMPLLIKPRDIIDALTKVNSAKRRGHSAPANVGNQQTVVNLILPTIITEKFAIDINNQVTKAGSQDLLTMASGNLLKQVEDAEEARLAGRADQTTIQARVGALLDEKASANGL